MSDIRNEILTGEEIARLCPDFCHEYFDSKRKEGYAHFPIAALAEERSLREKEAKEHKALQAQNKRLMEVLQKKCDIDYYASDAIADAGQWEALKEYCNTHNEALEALSTLPTEALEAERRREEEIQALKAQVNGLREALIEACLVIDAGRAGQGAETILGAQQGFMVSAVFGFEPDKMRTALSRSPEDWREEGKLKEDLVRTSVDLYNWQGSEWLSHAGQRGHAFNRTVEAYKAWKDGK